MFSLWRKQTINIEKINTNIVVESKDSPPDVFVHDSYAWLDIVYLTFAFIATFCMVKMTFDLPFLFSPENALRVEGVSSLPVENQMLFLMIGDEGLLNAYSLTIIIFLLLRLVLHLLDGAQHRLIQQKLDYMKQVWKQTLVLWGILFGIISTLGVLWQG